VCRDNVCQPIELASPGGICTDTMTCRGGEGCYHKDNSFSQGTCGPPLAPGSACTASNLGDNCEWPSVCWAGKCVVTVGDHCAGQ
jgi:hypothetical protein